MSGWKTYIVAVGVALVTLAQAQGWIDENMATTLYGLLGAGGLAALRAGVAKSGPKE